MTGLSVILSHFQDEREARETVKREQDDAYERSLAMDREKVRDNWGNFLLAFNFTPAVTYPVAMSRAPHG